jgi:hypothetical protein
MLVRRSVPMLKTTNPMSDTDRPWTRALPASTPAAIIPIALATPTATISNTARRSGRIRLPTIDAK